MSKYIIGADECGYGAGAGAVVVCAVKAPHDWTLVGLNDSKALTAEAREVMSAKLLRLASDKEIQYYIAERSNTYIDQYGLGVALKDAYVEAFKQLYCQESLIIIDGILKFNGLGVDDYKKKSIIKADTIIPAVMAGSIIGKVYRDAKMVELDTQYPQYGWKKNKGYLSKSHKQALKDYGFCDLHRKSYNIKL